MLLAASMQSVELLDAIPLLLEQIPKSEWPGITWRDPRLLSTAGGELWMALKGLVSIFLVTQKFDLVNRMLHDIVT